MIRDILYRISDFLPAREISDGETPYLERYYLCTVLGTRFYLHHFVGSDPDRGLHDHPWPWAFSIILAGWYWEETRSGKHRRRWFNALVGDSFHRVVLPGADDGSGAIQSAWTLFAHRAKRVKRWGFLRPVDDHRSDYTFHEPIVSEIWWTGAPKGRHLRQRRTTDTH